MMQLALVVAVLSTIVAKDVAPLRRLRAPLVDAGTQSLTLAMEAYLAEVKRDPALAARVHPPPVISVKFGHRSSNVAAGQYLDYGAPYAVRDNATGMRWGWNCNLDRLLSTRDGGGTSSLRSLVVVDRLGKCKLSPTTWRISVPPGDYTVRISGANPENRGAAADGGGAAGCIAAGVRLGSLSAANRCNVTEDNSCYVLPRVSVGGGVGGEGPTATDFAIQGSWARGCRSLNSVEFYEASEANAIALSTYPPLHYNVVDPAVAKARRVPATNQVD
jgi:hypothetical protein